MRLFNLHDASLMDIFQQEIASLSVRDKFSQVVSLQCMEVFHFKVTISENMFNNKIVAFTKVGETIFLAGPKYIK